MFQKSFVFCGNQCVKNIQIRASFIQPIQGDDIMQWTAPSFTDLRFGFEITMYIANR